MLVCSLIFKTGIPRANYKQFLQIDYYNRPLFAQPNVHQVFWLKQNGKRKQSWPKC